MGGIQAERIELERLAKETRRWGGMRRICIDLPQIFLETQQRGAPRLYRPQQVRGKTKPVARKRHRFPGGQHRRRRWEESSRGPSSGRPTCGSAGHGPKQHPVRAAAGYCPRRLASAALCSEQPILSDSLVKATPLGSNSWSESTAIARSS